MKTSICDRLDDYLDGDLPTEYRVRFANHLRDCSDCRQAVDEWLETSSLLKHASEELEQPSARLRQRVAQNLALQHRMHCTRSTHRAVVAMSVALCACAALFVFCVRIPSPPVHVAQHDAASDQIQLSNSMHQDAMLSFPDDVISVPIDIGQPDVIVVWTYSTVPNVSEQD